jgi:hypothetical protein
MKFAMKKINKEKLISAAVSGVGVLFLVQYASYDVSTHGFPVAGAVLIESWFIAYTIKNKS